LDLVQGEVALRKVRGIRAAVPLHARADERRFVNVYSFFVFVFVFVFFVGLVGATFFGSFTTFSFFGSFAGFPFFSSSRRRSPPRAFGFATSTGFASSLGLSGSGCFFAFTAVSTAGFSGLGLATTCNQLVILVTLPSRAVLLLMSSGTLHFFALSKESAEAESSPREKPRAALSIIPPACR